MRPDAHGPGVRTVSDPRPAKPRESRTLEALLGDERTLVLGGVLALCGLAWLWLFGEASGMAGAEGMAGTLGTDGVGAVWGHGALGYLFVMWAVMMVAMMLPSAMPTLLLFQTVQRNRTGRGPDAASPGVRVAAFVVGYVLVWTAFSAGAALSQWLLHRGLLLSPAMAIASPWLSGGLLLAAGAFQFTPLKEACVGRCRSPLSFLTSHWREGTAGALRMGVVHGAWCVGCCWALMALLFVLGVMNLVWVLALTLFVLLEKTVPRGRWVTRGAGALFVAWGGWVLLEAAGAV